MPRPATKKTSTQMASGTLSAEELDLLEHYVEIFDDHQLRITKQLDAAQYTRIKLILERLGGVYQPVRKRFAFRVDPAPLLAQTIALRQMPTENPLDFFASPPAVIEALFTTLEYGPAMLVLLAEHEHNGRSLRVLEPEAGLGDLADAVRARYPTATIDVCEIDPYRRAVLASKGHHVVADDFLGYHPAHDGQYNVVLMNPPFTLKGDTSIFVRHIQHARTLLLDEEESRLVAVVPATVTTAARYQDFYVQVLHYGDYEVLPQGSFVVSGTPCETGLITLGTRQHAFYEQWDTPDGSYPNLRLKAAWWHILREDRLLCAAHARLLRDMVEGRLPVYTNGTAAPVTQEAVHHFCQQVTRQMLSGYQLHLPFTPQDVFHMQQHLLHDYREARASYGVQKRAQWQQAQMRTREELRARIARTEERMQQRREQQARDEQQCLKDQATLAHLTETHEQAPGFVPPPELSAPDADETTPTGSTQRAKAPAPNRQYRQLAFF